MGLLKTFLDILRRDPPPGRPSVEEYCATEQERLNLEHECEVYKRELLRLGYRPEMLKAMATTNLTEVRRAS